MKFRISSKDLTMFIIFAIFLLYLCCLATGNLNALSNGGNFPGLNPFPGLFKFFGATILLFIIVLVVIITSASSLIFERKKGFGLEVGEKENKGYSRWAKEKEIKSDSGIEVVDPLATESPCAGIPLINDGKNLWVDNGEYHNLVIGATGSGKSQTIVEPMVELLIKKGESMIITDPKGELYKASSDFMRERGYNVIVLNFREPQNGNAWNPLTLPYQYYKDKNGDKATELLDDVALNILYDSNNKGDPFWEKSATDYFSGLALGLFEDATENEINLNSINFMSSVGEEKFAASDYIREYFKMKGESSNPYIFASNTINAPADTKGGILSVFRQKIRLFSSREHLSEMLSYSDFDMRDIGREKTAVFIVIQDEKTTYHSLATIFIKQCYETLIDIAQQNGGKLPYRTNFILDEFANMPPLKDVTTMVTAARSRSIRFTFIIQNFAQLKAVYGNENAETIKGNCGNLVYLISTELAALEEISKMCGEVKSGEKDKTASTPLVTVTDLQKLKLFEAIIIRWRKSPFKTKYTPNFKMDWGHPHSDAAFPTRQMKEVKLFDIKTFVKEKKRQNMLNSLENGSDKKDIDPFNKPNPFNGSPNFNSPNPFAGANPFSSPSDGGGMFGGLGGGLDLDAMMKDIDRKIAELDAEEARQKAELERKKQDTNISIPPIPDLMPTPPASPVNNLNIKEPLFKESIEPKEQLNIYDELNSKNKDLDNTMPSITEKPNIATATSSPLEDVDDFDNLPPLESTSIIHPNINKDSVTMSDNDYNIYNTSPSIDSLPKDDIQVYEEKSDKTKSNLEKNTFTEQSTNININVDNVKNDKNLISDDAFFDDFFGDD